MLFVQSITVNYEKDVRYPRFAAERRNMRFFALLCEKPSVDAEALVDSRIIEQNSRFINGRAFSTKTYGSQIFDNEDGYNLPVDNVVRVVKREDGYDFFFKSCNKKAFTLKEGEYGRVMYNYRRIDRDTRSWVYTECILNYYCADRSRFREKLFFRKKPDFEFRDMRSLR